MLFEIKICIYLTLCQFLKKNLIRNVVWKVSNFVLIFYVIRTTHKKSRQSLRPSTGRIGWDLFSKIGIECGKYFSKNVPNLEIVWPTPNTPRALTVKGVYVAEKLMGKTWGLGWHFTPYKRTGAWDEKCTYRFASLDTNAGGSGHRVSTFLVCLGELPSSSPYPVVVLLSTAHNRPDLI